MRLPMTREVAEALDRAASEPLLPPRRTARPAPRRTGRSRPWLRLPRRRPLRVAPAPRALTVSFTAVHRVEAGQARRKPPAA